MSKTYGFLRRVIAFAGAVIITFNIVAAPQRARAFAVSASVVASVAAIMTACGVGYWAASQQDAIDYLGGKIDDYLFSLEDSLGTVPVSYEDWLGINAASELFDVVSGGVMRFGAGVTNKILDFVRWFNAEEGVESGGPEVGLTGSLGAYTINYNGAEGLITVEELGDGVVRLNFTEVISSSSQFRFPFVYFKRPKVDLLKTTLVEQSSRPYYQFVMGPTNTVTAPPGQASLTPPSSINWEYGTGSFPYIDYPYIGFGIQAARNSGQKYTGYAVFQLSSDDMSFSRDAVVTPSAVVAVPDNLADDDSFDVAPSVTLTQGMTVDQASEAVLDGVASEDGLSSETTEAEGGALEGWGWLQQLLQRIERAISGTQEQTAPAQYEAIDDYQLDLTSFFPFCLPWDIHRGLSLLVAEPVAPSINWTVPLPDGSTYTLALDLSDWNGVAQVARTMELLAFVVALAVATKKLIKW